MTRRQPRAQARYSSQDRHGHSSDVHVRYPPGYEEIIGAVLEHYPNLKYKTQYIGLALQEKLEDDVANITGLDARFAGDIARERMRLESENFARAVDAEREWADTFAEDFDLRIELGDIEGAERRLTQAEKRLDSVTLPLRLKIELAKTVAACSRKLDRALREEDR